MKVSRSVFRLGALLALVAVLSGCSMFGSIEWEWKGPRREVKGYVYLRDLGVPLVGARIFFNGPIDRSDVTRRSGFYCVTLPNGTYDVTVRTLHDDYKTRVTIRDSEIIDFKFWAGSWFDKNEFLGLAGIRRYYFQNDRLTYDELGEMARWEQSKVKVFFDTSNAPWGAPASTWANLYFSHIRDTWRQVLKDTIAFERVYSASSADVEVKWAPAGSLVDGQGYRVATRTAYYWDDGSLRKVRIEIDEDYALEPGIWEHEWARAMGLSYTNDRNSVLYPALERNQRTELSPLEKRYAQLIYNLPSGLTKGDVWGMSAEQGEEGDEDMPSLVQGAGSGYAGHMRTLDGRIVPMDPFEAADTVHSW